MQILDIADELYRELDSPSSLSIASIAFWLRTNYGKLNTLLDTEFEITEGGDYEMSPTPTEEEKAIFKQIFIIYYYDTRIRSNLGAAAIDSAVEVNSDGANVKLISKNSIATNYIQAKKLAMEELHQLLDSYALNDFAPVQTAGQDNDSPYPFTFDERRR